MGEIVAEPAYVEAERMGLVPVVTVTGGVIHLVNEYLKRALCGVYVAFSAVLTPEMEKQLRNAGRKAREWTEERDRLVKEAVAAGGSLREVGAAVGLSHQAVKFIAHGRSK